MSAQNPPGDYDPACYLSPGNIRASGERNPAYTATYAFDNDFPALLAGAAGQAAAGDELFVTQPQSGRCRRLLLAPARSDAGADG